MNVDHHPKPGSMCKLLRNAAVCNKIPMMSQLTTLTYSKFFKWFDAKKNERCLVVSSCADDYAQVWAFVVFNELKLGWIVIEALEHVK